MADVIRCKLKIKRVFYPSNSSGINPGDWASFSADILEELEGNAIVDKRGQLRLSGSVPSLYQDKEYTVLARFAPHERYGPQYQIILMNEGVNLDDAISQRQFLERVLTDHQINVLYEQLENPFEAIKNGDLGLLCTVKGIGESNAQKMISAYRENIDNGTAYVELDSYGLTKNMIDKLVMVYGSADTLVAKIKENPYILMDDVDGIGWKRADEMAINAGMNPQSVNRTKAYISYYMKREATDGNTWVSTDTLINAAASDLSLDDANTLRMALYALHDEGVLWWDEKKTMFALSSVRSLEKSIAEELHRLLTAEPQRIQYDISKTIKELEKEKGIEYTEEQINAIRLVCSSNVSIITGYGGTGKSTVVAAVLSILRDMTFAQTALSGRAAARLSEITSEDGYTIHRLLGYKPSYSHRSDSAGSFIHSKNNPLDLDIVILDEVSMVGAELFYSLIQAVRSGSRLIMIGDDGQLESIGMCNVMKDMLNSGVIPTARLTKIHRQAAKSAIITESIKVRTAKQLTSYGWVGNDVRGELKDLELDIYGDAILSKNHIIEQFKRLYEEHKKADDIQIVLPQKYRGDICTAEINDVVQNIVNKFGKNEVEIAVTVKPGVRHIYHLREGDRVIVNKNNYDAQKVTGDNCPIYNGNKGIIKSIDQDKGIMIIDFEQWGEIYIRRKQWITVELAYALSCHKLQGSEAGYVIIGLDFSARNLLTREWLYTAITRAKRRCVICAETNALHYSITNSNVPFKQTFLKEFLQSIFVTQDA